MWAGCRNCRGMIRDISVGIKPILEFLPARILDGLQTRFFGADSRFHGILVKGNRIFDERNMKG
jgi:hypothetical protein